MRFFGSQKAKIRSTARQTFTIKKKSSTTLNVVKNNRKFG